MTACLHHSKTREDRGVCRECGWRFAMLSIVVNLGLASLKVAVGLLSGSRAMLAGALYSANDVLSAVAVAVSLKVATRPATESHPYGQGKAEFIAIGVVSIALAAGVASVLLSSLVDLVPASRVSHFVPLVLAAVCLVANEALARRGHCVAERLASPALATSAEHNRADAISSAAVIVGITATMLGRPEIDHAVAFFEAAHILALSGGLLAKSFKGLMDTGLPREDVEMVERACRRVDGVLEVESIRSRRAGTHVWVAAVVVVPAAMSVREAHAITSRASSAIRAVLGPTVSTQVRFQAGRVPTSPEVS